MLRRWSRCKLKRIMSYFCCPMDSTSHISYMRRCLQLAEIAAGDTAPNPMVGAVLVHNQRIIGEGYHQRYGEAHAEVHCVNSVAESDRHLIPDSTMYVSLEPCAHFGKTPPCADLLIEKKIKRVVVGCRDPFEQVNGKGIEKLIAAGVDVMTGILDSECKLLNKRFFTFHLQRRPYVILKWAESANGMIAANKPERTLISNEITNRLVHKWRAEEAAILIGTQTASADNPSLSTRLWKGNNPVRVVLDMELRLPSSLKVFDGSVRTIIFNGLKQLQHHNLHYHQLNSGEPLLPQILSALYDYNIQSILVEGGTRMLQTFLDENCWDEARIITNQELRIGFGKASPLIQNSVESFSQTILSDTIRYYKPLLIQTGN
jgi:diaminohydroxyphosphoribosylaminopyrimidine deaminase / 5-amino-6-(5-phosphoribosylamino)uracil reductase